MSGPPTILLFFSRRFVLRVLSLCAGGGILIVADTLALMYVGQFIGAYAAVAWSGIASLVVAGLFLFKLKVSRNLLLESMENGQLSWGTIYRYVGLAALIVPGMLPGPFSTGICLLLYTPPLRWLMGRVIIGKNEELRSVLVQHLRADQSERKKPQRT